MSLNQQPRQSDNFTSDTSSEHQSQFATVEHHQAETLVNKTKQERKWFSFNNAAQSRLSICFTLDSKGILLAVNLIGATCLGYTVEELIERPIFSLVYPEDWENLQTKLTALAQHPSQVVKGKIRLLGKDGSNFPIKLTLQSLQSIDAKTVFLLTGDGISEQQLPEMGWRERQVIEPWEEANVHERETLEFSSNPTSARGDACKEIDLCQPITHDISNAYDELRLRKQAEEALQQQFHRERLIGAIAQRIRQSLELEEILNTTVAEVRQFLECDRVIIFRFNPDWSGIVAVESVDENWISILGTTLYDHCFESAYMQPYKQGHIQATQDIYTAGLSQCHIDLLAQFQLRANLVVPILQGEQLWGLLIAHHCSEPRQWQPFEVDLLKSLSTQVAIALQQSELFRQVQNLNMELERQVQARTAELQLAFEFEATLKRITDRVRDSLDEGQILQTAVHELGVVLGVQCCNAALYDVDKGHSTICYEYTTSCSGSIGRVSQMSDYSELYTQLLEGKCFQFCSLTPNPACGQVAMLACPILDDQGVMGDLWLINHKYYAFHEQDIRLVQQVANQCAIAIRQARLYQATQAQVQALEKLNHLKDDFLSTVSHELRTPVCNIKMAAQMLEIVLKRAGVLDTEPNKATQYFQILHDECQREISLVNNLLDLSRLEAGTEPLLMTLIDPTIWIPGIAEPFIERAREQQQHLIVEIPAKLPALMTDLSDLERILSELLNNACKYTPSGGTITVSAQTTDKILQLFVSNSGVEIPERELAHIFDKFYRVPNHDPWKHGGTGLGLALVKKLVEHLGATIQVKSFAGQTTFSLDFPLTSM